MIKTSFAAAHNLINYQGDCENLHGHNWLVEVTVGAKELDKVVSYIRHGIAMAIGMASVFSIAGYFLTPFMLQFMDTSDATMLHAVPYLRIFFLSSIAFFLTDTTYAIFRASGDTRTPTKVSIIVVLLNMTLDPLLIFGWGPIPALGVAGASLASAIAIGVAATIIITKMLHGGLSYPVSGLVSQWPRLKRILNIARIGLPISTQQFVFIFVYWFLIKIVHQFGETAAAAMGIGNRMESFSYLTCYGFSVAASTMVGQNLGAKQPDRAARCAWGATGAAVGITFIISLVFILLPKEIASVFTNDPVVLEIAIDYLIILGITQTAMALEIVIEGAFGGAGDTLPPMIVMIPGSAIRVPLAYYLCFNLDWGINGVWWTLTITCALKAIVLSLWFKRGKWKLKEV